MKFEWSDCARDDFYDLVATSVGIPDSMPGALPKGCPFHTMVAIFSRERSQDSRG